MGKANQRKTWSRARKLDESDLQALRRGAILAEVSDATVFGS
jgi:hypothetical protein